MAIFAVLPPLVVGFSDIKDIETYWEYADAIAGARVPYRDFTVEYPPLALAFFCLVRTVCSTLESYTVGFIALLAAIDLYCRVTVVTY